MDINEIDLLQDYKNKVEGLELENKNLRATLKLSEKGEDDRQTILESLYEENKELKEQKEKLAQLLDTSVREYQFVLDKNIQLNNANGK